MTESSTMEALNWDELRLVNVWLRGSDAPLVYTGLERDGDVPWRFEGEALEIRLARLIRHSSQGPDGGWVRVWPRNMVDGDPVVERWPGTLK